MSANDAQRAARLRRRLAKLLADTDGMLPGSLIERSLRCGKQHCRCKADPPELHGPYLQWGYTAGRKRITRWLSTDQAERYRPEIERARRFRELVAELEDAEIRRVERAEGWGR
ncbi:MAG: hypothetical protein M0Z40_12555 [Actinomycetota bacterium]|nr:hypothetical protein [Actinomycetota bacterium]MDA8076034.1 hypothetical protein [Actinomycetota bacterium]